MRKRKISLIIILGCILLIITSCEKIERQKENVSTSTSTISKNSKNDKLENVNAIKDGNKTSNDSGNSSNTSARQSPSIIQKEYTDEEIDKLIEDKSADIDTLAMKEYTDSMYKLENEYTSYNLAIAKIKSCLGEMVFSTQDEIPNFELLTPKAYRALKNTPEYYPIYSSVSVDFISFIALSQQIDNNSNEYKTAVNKIRKDESEWDFLNGLNKLADSKGYYVIDLYVEDLLTSDRTVKIKGIRLNNGGSIKLEGSKENIIDSKNEPELDEYLKKYKRQINYGDYLKNGQWNLFIFEKRDVQPDEIILDLMTGQHLGLTR